MLVSVQLIPNQWAFVPGCTINVKENGEVPESVMQISQEFNETELVSLFDT